MTVATIDAVVAGMMFVAELKRLRSFDILSGIPAGTIELSRHPQSRQQNEHRSKDGRFRQSIGAVMKDLWHRRSLLKISTTNLRAQLQSQPSSLSEQF